MRPASRICCVALLVGATAASVGTGCGASARDYAAAAITAGVAIAAAAVNRAATDECWGNCGRGELCDPVSGLCVPAPPEGVVLDHDPCATAGVGGEGGSARECEAGPEDAPARAPETVGPVDRGAPVDGTLADPCRGLCFAGERCTVENGRADCVPATPR
ncbi:MAG: hypothetical protein HY908_20975 [Myxococcales bacterium]|nr:hypothetical protein [Myxococcales bacterium]